MGDIPLDKKFGTLCGITRAQHFAWRQAVVELCPDADPTAVVDRMWKLTGDQTAAAYLRHIDKTKPVAPQVAASIVWSSECMGEDAVAEPGEGPDEAVVRHTGCPWFTWHDKLGLLAEDRPGCDQWFRSTIAVVNAELGTKLQFETLESLPEGGSACVRRLWCERG
jgi:hypothetical protein